MTLAELEESRAAQLRRLAARPCIGWMDAHDLFAWASELEVSAAARRQVDSEGARMLAVALGRLTPRLKRGLSRAESAADLRAAGMTVTEVADELNLPKHKVRAAYRKFGVQVCAYRTRPDTSERDRTILDLYRQGISQRVIGEQVGLTRQRVHAIIHAAERKVPA